MVGESMFALGYWSEQFCLERGERRFQHSGRDRTSDTGNGLKLGGDGPCLGRFHAGAFHGCRGSLSIEGNGHAGTMRGPVRGVKAERIQQNITVRNCDDCGGRTIMPPVHRLYRARRMRVQRVIAIDPAPGKLTTVFDGAEYEGLSASELRDRIDQISSLGSDTLVCWDAPLTGPADPASAGMKPFDFTKRAIERFFSRQETGFKAPKGISVLGYGACPHWTISRSILGLPRVGPFDEPESKIPFHLLTGLDEKGDSRPSIVEIHPALAAWLWCRAGRRLAGCRRRWTSGLGAVGRAFRRCDREPRGPEPQRRPIP